MDNYTPIPDEIVSDLGIIAAAVWGRMWRYAQQDDGVCWASQSKIARELNIRRETVVSYIKKLIENGYLISIESVNGRSNSYKPVRKTNRLDIEPVRKTNTTCEKNAQVPVRKTNTKRELKKQDKILNNNNDAGTPWEGLPPDTQEPQQEPGPLAKLNDALSKALGITINESQPRHVEAGQEFIRLGIPPEIIAEAGKQLVSKGYSVVGLASVKNSAMQLFAQSRAAQEKPVAAEVY